MWDYEKIKLEAELNGHTSEVVIVRFLKPFPLLLTTDSSGQLYLWLTRPHKQANKCLVSWRNMFTLQKMCPISSVDSYYNMMTGKFLLLIADEMGYVRVQDISSILLEFSLCPVDVVKDDIKRNPWRVLAVDKAEVGLADSRDNGNDSGSENGDFINDVDPLLKEFQFVQIAQWQAHKETIKSI